MRRKNFIKTLIIHTLVVVVLLVALFPFIWMISTAFKAPDEVFSIPPNLIPNKIGIKNFTKVFPQVDFIRLFINSTIYALGSTVLYLFIIAPAGYVLAKYNFRGKKIIFICILASMMIPVEVLIVSLFQLLVKLGWLNTYIGMILPRVVDPFGIFLLRQHFLTIPTDYIYAGRIDGCSEFGIFQKIMLPMASSTLAVAGIFMFTWRWNELLWPLIAANKVEMHTLQVGISLFIKEWYVEWNYMFAFCLLSILPIIILFIFLQKYFVKGVIMTGIKG